MAHWVLRTQLYAGYKTFQSVEVSTGIFLPPAMKRRLTTPQPREGQPSWEVCLCRSPILRPKWIWRLPHRSPPSLSALLLHRDLTLQSLWTSHAKRNTPKRHGLGRSPPPHSLYKGHSGIVRCPLAAILDIYSSWKQLRVFLNLKLKPSQHHEIHPVISVLYLTINCFHHWYIWLILFG